MTITNPKSSSRAQFSCNAPDASAVFLIGKLGRREASPQPMARNGNGAWSAALQLPPGIHYYRFVIVYKGVINMPEGSATLSRSLGHWN